MPCFFVPSVLCRFCRKDKTAYGLARDSGKYGRIRRDKERYGEIKIAIISRN